MRTPFFHLFCQKNKIVNFTCIASIANPLGSLFLYCIKQRNSYSPSLAERCPLEGFSTVIVKLRGDKVRDEREMRILKLCRLSNFKNMEVGVYQFFRFSPDNLDKNKLGLVRFSDMMAKAPHMTWMERDATTFEIMQKAKILISFFRFFTFFTCRVPKNGQPIGVKNLGKWKEKWEKKMQRFWCRQL